MSARPATGRTRRVHVTIGITKEEVERARAEEPERPVGRGSRLTALLAGIVGPGHEWRDRAVCPSRPDLPWCDELAPLDVRAEMVAVCESCPVRVECAADADRDRAPLGVRAGKLYKWDGHASSRCEFGCAVCGQRVVVVGRSAPKRLTCGWEHGVERRAGRRSSPRVVPPTHAERETR